MIIKKRCMFCGAEVELFKAEKIGDSWTAPFQGKVYVIENEGELGWWDTECKECDYYYEYEAVEEWAEGKIDAFIASLQDADEVRSYIKAILTDCPEAREIARGVLEEAGGD